MEKAEATVRDDDFRAMLERIRQKAAQHKNVVVLPLPPEDGIICPRCHNTGWIEVNKNGRTYMAHCSECYEQRQVNRRLKQSGISPEDYKRYTLENFDGSRSQTASRMLNMAKDYLRCHKKNGPGFGIFGGSGLGKTHICIAVCQGLTRQYGEPHYYFSYRSEAPELLKAATSYRDDYDTAMNKWKSVPNLYIDDLFKLAGTVKDGHLADVDREELRLMFDLINARYINHLTTIFSSEFPIKDITAIDAALGSRIYEMINPYGLYVTGRNQRIGGKR
jgi:DNA replication protein DnaC|nr:MAG TPA: replicative helicase [Caudoviricetes sp.]